MAWEVGGVRITRVVEHVMPFPADFFAEAQASDIAAEPWLVPDFVDNVGRYLISFHTFVVESDGLRIVVDTCTGNSKDRPMIPAFDHQHRPFLTDLAEAGFAPETIDVVVCTHLHVDHVGWNTRLIDGVWAPTFANARYLFGAADLGYWQQSADPLHAPAFRDSVQPVIDAGIVDVVTADTELTSEVRLNLTPGHTPGHLTVSIGNGCIITGDVLHHPIQCGHPEWTASGDVDPDAARTTRQAFLEAAVRTNALVLGTHFAGTSAGRIYPAAGGYRFVPEDGG
ncbi:MBL fold metallo-hydrolase [Mycolicibacterium sphagni]|uniref:MBL fold metallo-hydrolase n=1 Tax=Mycolicibacterium sphagni TaxID=1786 RepID=A0ABX2K3B6_9MYCO|nr:MBL fold metallo-hydrolase [Mycolicibacterium sphagni]NTY61573.1 MBL fold metallo-hydrolase [Mycolicibacterium sphagni]